MSSFIFEIGTEELPVSFIDAALQTMNLAWPELCKQQRLTYESLQVLATPRRLAISAMGLSDKQSDLDEELLGPPAQVAWGSDGTLTKAAIAFAQRHEVDLSAVYRTDTAKGPYSAIRKVAKGDAAMLVLPRLLHELVQRIVFPKSMRWGEGDLSFGRPVHWLLAMLDDQVVDFSFAGVTASNQSRGHRFLSPNVFTLSHSDHYVSRLAEANVQVNPVARQAQLLEMLKREAKSIQANLVEDDFLLHENAGLVERPYVIVGEFDRQYLSLPEALIIAVMRDHQRYFALKQDNGDLLPRYLLVAGTALDPETIRKGNDRVLRARLADAQFFVTEDAKSPLTEHAAALGRVTYHQKLGSVLDKVNRLERVAVALCRRDVTPNREGPVNETLCAQAARLCKADLTSLTVGEFPDLQGLMGKFLAAKENLPPEVGDAIASHYQPKDADDALPKAPLAAMLAVADRIDTLVGCFGIGLVPTGSADPFALRRAALGIIRINFEGVLNVDLSWLIAFAYEAYQELSDTTHLSPKAAITTQLDDFFRRRLKVFLSQTYPAHIVDACMQAWPLSTVRDLSQRVAAVETFARETEFEALTTLFKRAHNITKDIASAPYKRELLKDDAELRLSEAYELMLTDYNHALSNLAYHEALSLMADRLRAPIDQFFSDVFVMVDDEEVKNNRLRLLKTIADSVRQIVAFELL